MITAEIIIKLKGCSKKERAEVKVILLKNYMKLLNAIEKEADYCNVESYWKDFTPVSNRIISAKKFISRYGTKKAKTNARVNIRF